ncbi:pilus assembly PilX N-terminal domain-containing protein [Clostridium gasigenes]|uniref:pilus assembly PilX N-terminal domain-containing protein n=1 Tax=Clostridium gasigenes TaxID=94869 RepID=UPI0014383000|nr:pilus assembly PilX N-terminal domain-containing protein [Clostridium gasigenes]NKF07885.1 hypothetical protein [Clostridium gasigenes]QSW20349.1 pilus assembly PilX N-terminal domain-containing protein [Clostridium gasigenes]
MKKKRRGSSLIIVIIVMAILFTTGSAILTLTASDYKMRTNASKKLENLYAADSGLDIVENVILKNSEAAIIYANKKIKEKYDGQEMTKVLYEKINVDFKAEFINFLGKEALGNGMDSKKDAILAQGIINGKYKVLNSAGDEFIWKENIDKKSEIEIIEYKYVEYKGTIIIKIKSTFETMNREIKNKKILTTKYTVGIPDYKEPISSDSVLIDIYPVFDAKVITADGNLTLKGKAEVKGDIWVKGDSELGENPAYAFDKYRGGISVENGELNLKGNIITNRTLHLKNKSKAIVTGDVYALNAYVGKSDKTGSSKDNKLQIEKEDNIGGNLIVNNDLSLNAINSNVSMNNFYGINDKTDDSLTNISKAMKSSSIIVNDTSDTSTLTVTNDTYIMGVAYINTLEDKYQTGESVAIKGNYIAYSDVLPGYEDKVTLKYYNPLQLIETIDGGETKASYFKKYYEENKNRLRNGGVYLNKENVYSTGAYVTKNKDDSSSVGNKAINIANVTEKRKEFAKNVFSMGNTNKDETSLYEAGKVSKTVESEIDFTRALSTTSINETYGKLKLNNDYSKTVVIKGKDDIETYDNSKYIVIDGSKALKAVIITNGDVIVTGEVDFTGNIIAKGNIEISNNNNKLTYDSNITRKVIAANYDVLKDILKTGTSIGQEADIAIGDKINIDITTDGYNLKGLLKTSNWKIVK